MLIGSSVASLVPSGFVVSGRSSAPPCGGPSRTPAPLPRASAADEQIMCGLLERCGELPVGEAGLAEFAEGLVAGEHEEKVERPGGCAVAQPSGALEVADEPF